MKPFDVYSLMQRIMQTLPASPKLFSLIAELDIRNNRLSRLSIEDEEDLHAMQGTEINGFLTYVWQGDRCVRFSVFNGSEHEARAMEAAALLQTLEGGIEVPDSILLKKIEPNPAYVVIACVRLRAEDGRHAHMLYYNSDLTRDEAVGFAKRKAAEYAAEYADAIEN